MTQYKPRLNKELKGVENNSNNFEESAFNFIAQKYAISKEEIIKLAEKKNELIQTIPIKILSTKELSSLEAIVKYLRENHNLTYKEIGALVNRNPNALTATYTMAKKKMPQIFLAEFENDTQKIPLDAFKKELSILESIGAYLHSIGHTYADISRLLNLDPRTVWTVCNRANKKLKLIDKAKSTNE